MKGSDGAYYHEACVQELMATVNAAQGAPHPAADAPAAGAAQELTRGPGNDAWRRRHARVGWWVVGGGWVLVRGANVVVEERSGAVLGAGGQRRRVDCVCSAGWY